MTLGRQRSVIAAQAAIRLNRPVGLVLQREAASDDPLPVDLHRVGTEANLLRYVTSPDGSHHVICHGEHRFRIIEFLDGYPFFVARASIHYVPRRYLGSRLQRRCWLDDRGNRHIASPRHYKILIDPESISCFLLLTKV